MTSFLTFEYLRSLRSLRSLRYSQNQNCIYSVNILQFLPNGDESYKCADPTIYILDGRFGRGRHDFSFKRR